MTASLQPLGFPVPDWEPPPSPSGETLEGGFCRLERLDPERHAVTLHCANLLDVERRNWTYLPYGPFETLESYRAWMEQCCRGCDPLFYAIVDLSRNMAVGVASYMRIDPANGSIEVGHLNYSPLLQRTPAATEAMFLMMKHAFELGYRRYEWKCNALNAPSRAAAQRLGFSFEGVFHQAAVVKGCNRDTAWYAVLDKDWPALKAAFVKWLDLSNFDARGKQQVSLSAWTKSILRQHSASDWDNQRPRRGVLHHQVFVVSDVSRSAQFYGPVLKFLGYECVASSLKHEDWRLLTDGAPHEITFVSVATELARIPHVRGAVGQHHHLAWAASSPQEVDWFFEGVLLPLAAQGDCKILDEPTRFPEYSPDYYAVYFEDPDGIKFEFVFNPPTEVLRPQFPNADAVQSAHEDANLCNRTPV